MAVMRIVKNSDNKAKIIEPYSDPKLMTVPEFAKRYGLGKTKAYRLANMNNFPKIKNGNKILVITSKVDSWLANNVGLEF